MKKILFGLLITLCMASSAFAVSENMNVSATFADPFTVDATIGAADFKTIYLTNADVIYGMDISALGTTPATIAVARTKASSNAALPTLTVDGAANAAVVTCGYMVLNSKVATLDLAVSITNAPIAMTSGGAVVANAPSITGISSNAFVIASKTLVPGTTTAANSIPLYIAPTIATTAALVPGTYQGTMNIDLILN